MVNITVVGGGNGAFATASHLSLEGHRVVLFEHPFFFKGLEEVLDRGAIEVTTLPSSNLKQGLAILKEVTSDPGKALSEAEIVFVVVPAFAQKEMAILCAPYIRDKQVFVLCPGNFGGSVEFRQVLKRINPSKEIYVGETESLMYACRKTGNSSIFIRGYKHSLGFSCFPAMNNKNIYQLLQKFYPYLILRKNVLETGLSNTNTLIHVPIMLFNLSNIDNQLDMRFYHEAFTESIGTIVKVMDQERMQINKSGIVNLLSIEELLNSWYGYQGIGERDSACKMCKRNPIYRESKMPTSINHRYLSEDIPFGLIPMINLLDRFGYDSGVSKAVAKMASILLGEEVVSKARDLKALGVGFENEEQLKGFLLNGEGA